MSVPNQTPYIIYNANGMTTVFPFEFYIINANDIQISLNGEVISSGYSVSGVGNIAGGDVIFLTPPANGTVVMLERVVPTYRLTDYQDNGDLLADTVNKDFDRLWMAIQRYGIHLGLALKRPLFGGPFDAEGYRISNLADPVNDQDAATKKYVESVSLARTLRVPENTVQAVPSVSMRANKLLAFNAAGDPIAVLPASGSASDVLIELAKPTGAGLSGTTSGGTVQTDLDKLNIHTNGYVSVLEYIPKNLHQYLTDYAQSQTNAGDLISYLNAASAYCETNHKDLVFPFGYYFVSNTFMLPAGVKVIGLGYPYILSIAPFNSSNIIVSCDKTGQPTYDMDMFHINGPGVSNLNMVGLRVGGCRNSKFSRIIVTSCFSAGVEVFPTVATSGDVENLQLDHVWTVLSGGVRFKANASIARGNITDATVSNCQLTTGDATTSGNPAITITGATGRQIFGIAFNRVFTQTTDTDHIVINPNGGSVFHNTFSDISGESWTLASGGISNSFAKNALYVLDGAFTANSFRDFYKQSLPGNGITLGIGSSGNLFDGLRFTDRNVVGYNNRWLIIPSGANSNSFHACYFDGSFNRADSGYGGVAANYVFRDNDGKISDLSGSTKFDTPEIRDVSPVLIKRSTIFAISGNQLVNYPVTGCAFATTADGISVAVPAGSTAYLLTIPFTPTAGFSGKFIGFTIKYVCGAMNGMTLSADICGAGSSITDLTTNKSNVFSMYGAYNSGNKTVTLTFGGTRTAQANMTIRDIIITEGANIPYIPNFRKIYIES
ncbi:phage tail fiber protein [Enterobacter sp. 166D1]|uniref:phage tail fiber domain-containing protein n=1 Tax=Enterobacter TaxID=547 RepID=UPI002A8414A5|nr:phage tail fiber protein [Enterobacter sp. 166D1]